MRGKSFRKRVNSAKVTPSYPRKGRLWSITGRPRHSQQAAVVGRFERFACTQQTAVREFTAALPTAAHAFQAGLAQRGNLVPQVPHPLNQVARMARCIRRKSGNPGGRPTDYREEFIESVQTFCADGYSLTAFAGEIGVCRDTISEWCSVHPEFSVAVSRAKAKRARWWEERAREIAQNGGPGGQATMVIFGLKNHAPDDFKEVTRQEHTGKDGGPIATQILTPEQKAEQAVRLIDETFGLVSHGGADADR